MGSLLYVPVTLWNDPEPTFRVSSIRITPNGKHIVASTVDGALGIWDLNVGESSVTPRSLLMSHSDAVTCLECTDEYVISASEGGEMCRWNVGDGYCTKSVQSVSVHRRMQIFKCSKLDDDLLFTCGDYHEILIIHSVILHTVLVLRIKSDSDWVSCFHVMSSLEIGHDVVSAVTRTGFIKLWVIQELSDDVSYEVQSSLLPVRNVSFIKCSATQTQILAVCDMSWTLFDAKYLKPICTGGRMSNEKFNGGDFFDSDILIWTNECKFYLFKLGAKIATIKMVFSDSTNPGVFEPAMSYYNSKTVKCLMKCDVTGRLTMWKIGSEGDSSPLTQDLTLNIRREGWKKFRRKVTCCIVISCYELFVVGFEDGAIMIFSAMEAMTCGTDTVPRRVLHGHSGRVNCLLYPHEKHPYHDRSNLLSGGSDFSVCLWDIHTHRLIHKFCVQSGEIIKLLTTPEECKSRVKNSVCSVASDNSVAILNLKELKCIVLASRQLFPVVTINWRPLDDFIVIECFDGTVYIWEMETGHLDRVVHGATAQEVIYACKENNMDDPFNFYFREDFPGRDHFRRGLFHIEKDPPRGSSPVVVRGFLGAFHSQNQIVAFNIGSILGHPTSAVDENVYRTAQALTQPSPPETHLRGMDVDVQNPADGVASCLLSTLRDWFNAGKRIPFGVISPSQNVSVFLSDDRTPVVNAINSVALAALSSVLKPDETFVPEWELDVRALARLWQNTCGVVRAAARKLLVSRLESQTPEDRASLLRRWFKYLPHFTVLDGTPVDPADPEIMDMQATALVLFGVFGSDFKFKDLDSEEMYAEETSAAILGLLQETRSQRRELQVIATDILGRGYNYWEANVKFDVISRFLFDMTFEYDKFCYGRPRTPDSELCLTAHDTLVSIAIARTDSFVTCLARDVSSIRSASPKPETAYLDRSKTEMILILSELLDRTPYMMLRHLNDAVTVLLYCINANRLKHEAIGSLVPVLLKFKQVQQCLSTHRVAVGLHDGSVVIHELKTFKTHRISAHGDAVNAVMFSPDGRVLATYCYFENRLSFWHLFASIFGLGHVHIKCIKTYETNKISDESVRNHLDVGDLSWIDNKSVLLHLCDGTQTVFHV